MIIIDDNFISEEYVKMTEDVILSETRPIYWTINKQTNVPDSDSIYAVPDENTYQTLQIVSYVDQNHPLYSGIVGIFKSFIEKHSIEYKDIIRIKINLIPKADKSLANKYHMPHVDADEAHKVFLYYVCDSDGDTFFFDQVLNGTKPESFSIRQQVSPKQGRGVVFDGSIYHASSSPIESSYRCIINIDFE